MYPIHIKPFHELTLGEYHRIVEAREAVFFLEQHITESDADAVDPKSIFLWMEEGERVIAFLRIIPRGIAYQEVSIGRMLVDVHYRRQGLCRHMMQQAIHYVEQQWGAQPIHISAQQYLVPFYTALGFVPVSAPYLEAGIPHVSMLRH